MIEAGGGNPGTSEGGVSFDSFPRRDIINFGEWKEVSGFSFVHNFMLILLGNGTEQDDHEKNPSYDSRHWTD